MSNSIKNILNRPTNNPDSSSIGWTVAKSCMLLTTLTIGTVNLIALIAIKISTATLLRTIALRVFYITPIALLIGCVTSITIGYLAGKILTV